MADWTTPKTWLVDELVTAPVLNTQVRDNLGYLFLRPVAQSVQVAGAAYGISSTSWVGVDATALKLTLTVKSGRVMIGLVASVIGNAGGFGGFRVNIDNGARFEAWGESLEFGLDMRLVPVAPMLVTGLSAAAHTFALEAKVISQVMSVQRSPAAPLRFFVMEV